MNDLTTTTAAGLPADLGWTIKDVITKDELQAMPMGMRIEFVPELRAHFENMAREMAASDLTREHLQEKPDACLSVIKNALNWRMDPRAVAGKTYSPAKGQIAIEGVLASAIMLNSGRISSIEYEHVGDWTKVENKFKQEASTWPDGNPKKKYNPKTKKYDGDPLMKIIATWEPEDEKGLGCIGHANMKNGKTISTPTIWLASCHPRNATTWPTAPGRQILHVVERALCNMICGDILMGVHIDAGLTRHFEEHPDQEPKDVTPKARAEDMMADIKGNGSTEPMQTGGYSEVDPDTGEVLEQEPAKPARKRVKLTFRDKEIYKTAFIRDIKQMIDAETDPGALETLQDDVTRSVSALEYDDQQPIANELGPIFHDRFDVLDGEEEDPVQQGNPFDGIDLAGDED